MSHNAIYFVEKEHFGLHVGKTTKTKSAIFTTELMHYFLGMFVNCIGVVLAFF